ncbi:MAG: HAD hydrolase-like protein [Patescibacteria group bacterium]
MAQLWTPGGYRYIEAAGFDLDGVKRDTGYNAYQTLLKILAKYKYDGPKLTYGQYLLREFDNTTYINSFGLNLTRAQIKDAYDEFHPPDHNIGPYEDVAPACEYLIRKGLKLFAVSAGRAEWVHDWYKDHGLHIHFEHVVSKAHPKSPHITRLCGEMRVAPERAFYAGDMGHDIWAARDAQVVPIGITRGYDGAHKSLQTAGAHVIVDTLEELARLVR